MKSIFPVLLAWFLSAVVPALAQNDAPELRLEGIVSYGTNQLALLHLSAPPPRGGDRDMMLAKGQREGDVEVIDIDAAGGRIKVRVQQRTSELSFSGELAAGSVISGGPTQLAGGPLRQPASLRLQQAAPDQVFRVYQLLAGRTLIRPAALPSFRLSLHSEAVTAGDLLDALQQALAERGSVLRAEGEKFLVATAAGAPDYITSDVRGAAAALAKTVQSAAVDGTEVLPAGVINFPHTDFNQVLLIFQELANRTVIRPATLPAPVISLRTYSPLTRGEVLFAFAAVLAANGLAVVPAGDKFMLVCPVFQRPQVKALAERTLAAKPGVAAEARPPATINLPWADLNQVLALYREVSGRTIEVADSLPRLRFSLRSQTSLTPAEALTALDLLLGVNGLAVVPGNDAMTAKLVATGASAK